MQQTNQDITQDQSSVTNENNNNTNITLTHGLLAEDFKQNLLIIVQNHQLDIQTKAIILDSVSLATNMAAKQQTQIELEEYQKKCEANNKLEKETL